MHVRSAYCRGMKLVHQSVKDQFCGTQYFDVSLVLPGNTNNTLLVIMLSLVTDSVVWCRM